MLDWVSSTGVLNTPEPQICLHLMVEIWAILFQYASGIKLVLHALSNLMVWTHNFPQNQNFGLELSPFQFNFTFPLAQIDFQYHRHTCILTERVIFYQVDVCKTICCVLTLFLTSSATIVRDYEICYEALGICSSCNSDMAVCQTVEMTKVIPKNLSYSIRLLEVAYKGAATGLIGPMFSRYHDLESIRVTGNVTSVEKTLLATFQI